MEELGSHWTDFHEIRYLSIFFENMSRKFKSLKSDKKTGTLHKHVCTFMTVFRSILLRMRNVSTKMCGEKTHFIFRNIFSEDRAI